MPQSKSWAVSGGNLVGVIQTQADGLTGRSEGKVKEPRSSYCHPREIVCIPRGTLWRAKWEDTFRGGKRLHQESAPEKDNKSEPRLATIYYLKWPVFKGNYGMQQSRKVWPIRRKKTRQAKLPLKSLMIDEVKKDFKTVIINML